VVVTIGAALIEGTGRTDAVGIGCAIMTLICECCFTLLAVPVLARHGPWGVSVHSVWIGAVMFGVLAVLKEGPQAGGRLGAAQWAAIGYLAVGLTAIAFICWYSAVRILGSGAAGLLTGVAPIAAAVAGMFTGSTVPGWTVWAGMAAVVVGLSADLASRRERTAAAAQEVAAVPAGREAKSR